MEPSDDEVAVRMDERRDVDGHIIRIRVLDVPPSEKFPDGIKYAYHYGRKGEDDPIIRYDNHHGYHERHDGEDTEEIEFPGLVPLLRRFQREIDHELPR